MTDTFALLCSAEDACRLAAILELVVDSPNMAAADSDHALLLVSADDLRVARWCLRLHDEEGAR